MKTIKDDVVFSITVSNSDKEKIASTIITELMYDCFNKKNKVEWLGNQVIKLIEILKKDE